jgi:hypothetical protein
MGKSGKLYELRIELPLLGTEGSTMFISQDIDEQGHTWHCKSKGVTPDEAITATYKAAEIFRDALTKFLAEADEQKP